METIQLPVKAKHFQGTRFGAICDCALAKAAKEFFNVSYANEGVDILHVGNGEDYKEYIHEEYTDIKFYEDQQKAASLNFDETILFTIELKLEDDKKHNL